MFPGTGCTVEPRPGEQMWELAVPSSQDGNGFFLPHPPASIIFSVWY